MMKLWKKLFLCVCLLSTVFICSEKGIAQGCYQNTDCPNYNTPLKIPGSWQAICSDAWIFCYIGDCALQATCKSGKKRPNNPLVGTRYAISCAEKGDDLSIYKGNFKCIKK